MIFNYWEYTVVKNEKVELLLVEAVTGQPKKQLKNPAEFLIAKEN